MHAQNRLFVIIVAVIAMTGLVQCGNKKSKSQNVSISAVPEKPIVFAADVLDGNGNKSIAPWFDFTLTLKNGSTQAFKIVGVVAEITITDSNGSFATKTFAGDPSIFNRTLDEVECTYSDFGTWAVNVEKTLEISTSAANCRSGAVSLRVDQLPKGSNYRYRVKVKPMGFFIDSNNLPEDRFEKQFVFYTQ